MVTIVVEQQQKQRPAVAARSEDCSGGDRDKKKKRRSTRRTKQNSPPSGPAFNSGQQGEATQCLQNNITSASCSSLRRNVAEGDSDVGFISVPAVHLGEQGMKHNFDSETHFKSCPTPLALNDLVRSASNVDFLPPHMGGCSQRSCFDPHWPLQDVNEALGKGEAFQATFRVNAYNRLEAYCTIDGVPVDILICGIPMQNRAIEGDAVAITVDPPTLWTRMKGYNAQSNKSDSSHDPLAEADEDDSRLKGKGKLDDSGSVPAGELCEPACEEELDNVMGSCEETINSEVHEQNGSSDTNSNALSSGFADEVSANASDQTEATCAVKKLCKVISLSPSKRPTGRVVAIIEPSPRRNTVVGLLSVKQWLSSRESCGKSNKKKKTLSTNFNTEYIQFSPTDPKFPKMVVLVGGLPDGIKKRLIAGDNTVEFELVAARIDEWGAKFPLPQASVLRTFGQAGEMEPHIDAILCENCIPDSEFSSESMLCLPPDSWEVPQTEIRNRRDVRNLCVFTVDPSTATDLDDALSVQKLSGKVYRVGVHISDVTYFVQPDTALDKEARIRSTTVYMIKNKVPMLPPKLSENFGSLTPGKDRLAFSIFWDMDISGNILDRWVGRTVIHSCCKLSYEDAEDILKGRVSENNSNLEEDGFPKLHGNFEWKDVMMSLRTLHEISKVLKEKRLRDGAIVLDNSKVGFLLDEFGVPRDIKVYDRKDSNFLVEEFMLLANTTAAEIISCAYPENALLRSHPLPDMGKMAFFLAFCEKHGVEIDLTSSRILHSSLLKIREKIKDDPVLYDILISNATKTLQVARYFCTGDTFLRQNEWGHYALAVPFYTHFTSPIRRYPDIVVHRTLSAAVEAEKMYMKCHGEDKRCFTGITFDRPTAESVEGKEALSAAALKFKVPSSEVLKLVAIYCNVRKLTSRKVKDAIDRLYLWILVKNKQFLLDEARVLTLGPRFMDVYIPKLAVRCHQTFKIERRIQYDEVEGLATEWFQATSTLVLSLSIGSKRFNRRGSPSKYRPLEYTALIVNPSANDNEDITTKSENPDPKIDPAVFPLTVRCLSTIPVALFAVGGVHGGPLDIAARLYVSSYFA